MCSILTPNHLDDLEDCRAANEEHEQSQNPRSYGILFRSAFGAFWYITPEHNILGCLLIGNLHLLCFDHCSVEMMVIR